MNPDGSAVIPQNTLTTIDVTAAKLEADGLNSDVLNNAKKELMIGDTSIRLPAGMPGIQMPVQQQKLAAKKAGGLGFVKKLFGGK
jgi:hypothetical protein